MTSIGTLLTPNQSLGGGLVALNDTLQAAAGDGDISPRSPCSPFRARVSG